MKDLILVKTNQTYKNELKFISLNDNNYIETHAINAFLNSQIFDLNSQLTRDKIIAYLLEVLEGIVCRDIGLYQAHVVCNDDNNPLNVINNDQLKVDIYTKAFYYSKFVKHEFIITYN